LPRKRQGRQWFGGLGGEDPFEFPVTAIAIAYTSYGFAVAADGRLRWGEDVVPEELSKEESDEAQKILKIESRQGIFACTLRGDTLSRHGFDVGIELINQAMVLRGDTFRTCFDFIRALSTNLGSAMEIAKKEGRTEGYLQALLTFVGYFKGNPCWMRLEFDTSTGKGSLVMPPDIRPGMDYLKSSPKIECAFRQGDKILADFRKPFGPNSSLKEATDYAEGFIQACCSDAAFEIDSENARYFGGRIHVATVTPPDRSLKSRILRFGRSPLQSARFQWEHGKGQLPIGPPFGS
jgi:hypothetical protein